MRPEAGIRVGLHTFAIAIIGAGLIVVFPTHPEIGWGLIAIGLLTSLSVELNQRWPRPLEVVVGRLWRPQPVPSNPFMPLRDAARELYEADLDGWLGRAARLDPGHGANPLLWCAYHLRERLPEIYGRRPPSTVLERKPPDLFNRLHFDDDVTRLSDGSSGGYVDLAVKRDAFRAAFAMLTDHHRSPST